MKISAEDYKLEFDDLSQEFHWSQCLKAAPLCLRSSTRSRWTLTIKNPTRWATSKTKSKRINKSSRQQKRSPSSLRSSKFSSCLFFHPTGARVIMACRNVEKGEEAAASIRAACPRADVEVRELDLADACSIRAFAQKFLRGEFRAAPLQSTDDVSQLMCFLFCLFF